MTEAPRSVNHSNFKQYTMKRIFMLVAILMVAGSSYAQRDTTANNIDTTANADTLRVGSFIIIKKNRDVYTRSKEIAVIRKPYKPEKVSTNWWIFDLGFANLNDKTSYGSAETGKYLRTLRPQDAPVIKEDLKLRAIKSSNVNIWVVMQKLNLAKGYLNLKYGVGLEMFNFRYESNISYNNNPAFIFRDTISFSKNKLYAGYVSVPFMINLNTHPGHKNGLSLSAGISAGYLVESRNKQISEQRGKVKTKGNLGLEQFRLAYIGELGLGPVRLFGSYSLTPLHEMGLDQYPYSLGLRLSTF